MMLDLGAATQQMASLLAKVTDDQLTAPTPCPEYTLGDLIDHVRGLSYAFTIAATKEVAPGASRGGSGDATRLGDDWRERIPEQLAALAEAWRSPAAWEGMTRAGGLDLPGEVAGKVALNEVVVHGWDVAQGSGQPYDVDPQALEACRLFLSEFSVPDQPAESRGPFGPAVDVPADAPLLDRVIGLSGRNPAWTPPR